MPHLMSRGDIIPLLIVTVYNDSIPLPVAAQTGRYTVHETSPLPVAHSHSWDPASPVACFLSTLSRTVGGFGSFRSLGLLQSRIFLFLFFRLVAMAVWFIPLAGLLNLVLVERCRKLGVFSFFYQYEYWIRIWFHCHDDLQGFEIFVVQFLWQSLDMITVFV